MAQPAERHTAGWQAYAPVAIRPRCRRTPRSTYKRVVAWQVEQAMQECGLTKTAMAHEMHTSRAALDRLLEPVNTSVTLHTLQRASAVVGKRVQITLEDAHP